MLFDMFFVEHFGLPVQALPFPERGKLLTLSYERELEKKVQAKQATR